MPEIDPQDAAEFAQSRIDPADLAEFKARGAPKGFGASAVEAAQQVYPGFLTQQQAASQQTTPVIQAQAPNFLGPATADELGNVGYKDVQGNFVPTDQNKHVALLDPADNMVKVYARTPETAAKTVLGVPAEAMGHMVGSMFGPGNVQVSKAVPAAISAAERLNVQVPRAITTESPLVRFGGQVAARAPGGGPLQEAIPRSIEQLGGRVQEAADLAGGAVNPAAAGEGFSGAVEQAFKPRTGRIGQETSRAYDAVEGMLDPNRSQPLRSTLQAVEDITTRRGAAGLPETGKAAGSVMEAVTRPEGLTYSGIKDLRTNIGEMLNTGRLPEGFSEHELRRIYGALSDDLRTSVIDAGGPRAAVAFERANKLAAGVAEWKDTLRKVIGSSTRSGEGVYEAIARMAGTGPSADRQALLAARTAVPPEVWSDVASTAISQLGRGRTGVFSPAQFLSDYRNLSDVGKRVLFGATANNVTGFLDDIAQVSESFAKASKLANVSGTAGHQAFYTALTSIFGGIAATAAAGPVALLAPVAAIGGIIGNNVMSRVLATPATVASFGRWARVYQTVAERPTPAGLAAFQRTSGELAKTLNGTLGTKVTPDQIMRSTVQGPGTGQASENQNNIRRPSNQ